MVTQLGESFDFWILTADRDLHDTEPYPFVPLAQWVAVGKAQVFYADEFFLSLRKISRLINDLKPDIVYVNSLFSSLSNKYLVARRLRMLPQIPTIVAPRGVFSPGALRFKQRKKDFYLHAAQRSGLFTGLAWQASSELEKRHILSSMSGVKESDVYIVPNITMSGFNDDAYSDNGNRMKKFGRVRFTFLSRIAAKKNLEFALNLLNDLNGLIQLDIAGPIDDPSYWNNCKQVIAKLPQNVTTHVHGAVAHDAVGGILSHGHFLLLPTLGENFGHVILEALKAGCPPIISDQTPWNDLENAGAGWIIPLEDIEKWISTLQYCIDMDQDEFRKYSKNARQYASRWLSSANLLEANKNMFINMFGRSNS